MQIIIPEEVSEAIADGAALALSVSGGKDSQALLKYFCEWYKAEGIKNKLFAIHADLGRAEWKQTPAFVEKQCRDNDIELVVVRAQYEGKEIDLLDRIKRRATQLEVQEQDSPPFPSAKARYCTSDLKTKPINDYLRNFDKVISIEGICWHESQARAEKPRVKIRKEIATYGRKALTWNAVIDWSLEEIWASHGQSVSSHRAAIAHYEATGEVPDWWTFHPVYAMGNTRLSCSLCILGSKGDYLNGVKHNPDYADEIHEIEVRSGYSMKQGLSIAQSRELLKQGKL